MKVKVIGKRSGKSKKSGKQYFQVFYLSKVINGEGEVGDSVFIEENEFSGVQIGKTYDVEFDRGGFLVSFKPAG